jgi:hypothetical protein
MRGGLRWPYRPFQVTCVLVAVLLTAAFSLMLSLAKYAEGQPICDEPTSSNLNRDGLDRGSLGERINAKTIAIIFGNPKAISGNPKAASTQRTGERGAARSAAPAPSQLASA